MISKVNNKIVKQILHRNNELNEIEKLKQNKPHVQPQGNYIFKHNSHSLSSDDINDSINHEISGKQEKIPVKPPEFNKPKDSDFFSMTEGKHLTGGSKDNNATVNKQLQYTSLLSKNLEKSKLSLNENETKINTTSKIYQNHEPLTSNPSLHIKIQENDDEFIVYKKEFSNVGTQESARSELRDGRQNTEKRKERDEFLKAGLSKDAPILIEEKFALNIMQEKEKKQSPELKMVSEQINIEPILTKESFPRAELEKDKKPIISYDDVSYLDSGSKIMLGKGESVDTLKAKINDFCEGSSIQWNVVSSNREIKLKDTLSEDSELGEDIIERLEGRIVNNGNQFHLNSKGIVALSPNVEKREIGKSSSKSNLHYKAMNSNKINIEKDRIKENRPTPDKSKGYQNKNTVRSIPSTKKNCSKMQIQSEFASKRTKQNSEEIKVNAFNRLIEDANRRIQAINDFEKIRSELDNNYDPQNTKKYNPNDWDFIYKNRFKNFLDQKNMKIGNEIEKKKELEKEKEKLIIEEMMSKTKKASFSKIEQSAQRMYQEAEKQKLKKEHKIQQIEDFISLTQNLKSPKQKVKRMNSPIHQRLNSPTISKQKINPTMKSPIKEESTNRTMNRNPKVIKESKENYNKREEEGTKSITKSAFSTSRSNLVPNLKTANVKSPISKKNSIPKKANASNNYPIFIPNENIGSFSTNDLKHPMRNPSETNHQKNRFVSESEAEKLVDNIMNRLK